MKVSKVEKNKRSETINLRIESSHKDLIDLAANVTGKTRSAFMLDAAYQKAQETLLDRRLFYLDEKQWETFNQLLETSPADNEQLSHLLNHKAPWE
ncbi:DUF1778 domain-containing protein [Cyanobacterium sp. Dongsha4]|uniref:type II toxin-antitoxin system TacA family antitoxin n=1 Tax=Cyanobacterium sp. DS4 TaxID=2878255 RepID=UPI002E80FF02|nr:DUF1778 domain-containing protein [Cyanobacterium sp. Dongsha4]WVK99140.1 DUF1778 domain-containing protein [Cyanobacterium sp. Dongsha4]